MMALNSNSLPTIRCYEDCDKLFKRKLEELPKHRRSRANWSETKLPLDDWRKEHLRIELQDSGDYYGLIYHSTTVLGYYPDGRVFFNASWDSRSTHVFFDELSPGQWNIRRARGARFYVNGFGEAAEWHVIPLSGYFWLGADGRPTNPQDFTYKTEVANRERRKELREIMKPFYTWYLALTRATGSMRSVLCDTETVNHLGQAASQGRLNDYASALGGGQEMDDNDWRALVTNAYVANVTFYARQNERGVDATLWGPTVLEAIEKAVWRHCGGYKDEVRTVKAGEKP